MHFEFVTMEQNSTCDKIHHGGDVLIGGLEVVLELKI